MGANTSFSIRLVAPGGRPRSAQGKRLRYIWLPSSSPRSPAEQGCNGLRPRQPYDHPPRSPFWTVCHRCHCPDRGDGPILVSQGGCQVRSANKNVDFSDEAGPVRPGERSTGPRVLQGNCAVRARR